MILYTHGRHIELHYIKAVFAIIMYFKISLNTILRLDDPEYKINFVMKITFQNIYYLH